MQNQLTQERVDQEAIIDRIQASLDQAIPKIEALVKERDTLLSDRVALQRQVTELEADLKEAVDVVVDLQRRCAEMEKVAKEASSKLASVVSMLERIQPGNCAHLGRNTEVVVDYWARKLASLSNKEQESDNG